MKKEDNSKKTILSLCSGTGTWEKPYKENGYNVVSITLPDNDVRTYKPPENVYGILAAPPCTMFSLARTKANKPRDLREGMECVRACLNIIWACMEVKQDTRKKTLPLKFWAFRKSKRNAEILLGKPAFEFNPMNLEMAIKKELCYGVGSMNLKRKLARY